jgi:polyferredoxin
VVRSLAWNVGLFSCFSQSFQKTASVILKLFHDHFLLQGGEFIYYTVSNSHLTLLVYLRNLFVIPIKILEEVVVVAVVVVVVVVAVVVVVLLFLIIYCAVTCSKF